MQPGETLREADGLAMSSRNLRLNAESRAKAVAVYQALSFVKQNIRSKSIPQLKQEASEIITNAGFNRIDYVEICDANTLLPVEQANASVPSVALVAAFLDGVRLIDNMVVG